MIHSRNIIRKTSASSSIINVSGAGSTALLQRSVGANFINLYYKLQQHQNQQQQTPTATAALITNNTTRSFFKNMIHRQQQEQEQQEEVQQDIEAEEEENDDGGNRYPAEKEEEAVEEDEEEDGATGNAVTMKEIDMLMKSHNYDKVIEKCEAAMLNITPLVAGAYMLSMLHTDRLDDLHTKIPLLMSASKSKRHTLFQLIKVISFAERQSRRGNRHQLLTLLLEKAAEHNVKGSSVTHLKIDSATTVQQMIDALQSAKQANIRVWNSTHSLAASKFINAGEVALAVDEMVILHEQGVDLPPRTYEELLYYTSTRPEMTSECDYLLKVRLQKMQFTGVTSRTGTMPLSALNVVINGAASVGNFELVEKIWKYMSHLGYEHQPHHYHCVFEAYIRARQYTAALNTLREMESRQIPLHMQSLEVLSRLLAKNVDGIDEFYYEMLDIVQREGSVPVDMINLIIRACHFANDVDRGFATYSEIESSLKMVPNVTTYNYMIALCSGQFHTCKKLWAEMLAKGIKPDTFTYNSFFRMCDKTKMMPKALEEFRKCPPSEGVNVKNVLYKLHQLFLNNRMPRPFMNQLEDLFTQYNVQLPNPERQHEYRQSPQQFQSQQKVLWPRQSSPTETTTQAPPANFAKKQPQQNNNSKNNNNNGQQQQQKWQPKWQQK